MKDSTMLYGILMSIIAVAGTVFYMLVRRSKEPEPTQQPPDPVYNPAETVIGTPDWQVEKAACEGKVLRAIYQEKYGSERIVYCMVVFYNKKTGQYKLDAPWFESVILEQSNIDSHEIVEVDKSEMPK